MWQGLGDGRRLPESIAFEGSGDLPSIFAVSDFAAAAVGLAGLAVAELIGHAFGECPVVRVNRRLASLWFGFSITPEGWSLPTPWDPIAGDYAAADGWIRLHTNAPHHREAALAVLRVPAEKTEVERAVAGWKIEELEAAVIERGGCAAAMRSREAWQRHPQGAKVREEPLIAHRQMPDVDTVAWRPSRARPLAGLRVLDLTRVLAGPVATRFLAGFGAEVLRIDPPDWDEPVVVPEVTLGKRCARLDLKEPGARGHLQRLLAGSHVLVHGYRADALEALGLGAEARREIRPGLVDVCLDAYGWSGPWCNRRGFDSLVQMSCGIAEAGMRRLGRSRPTPLPVQALDQATGYLMAAAAVRGLTERLRNRRGYEARTSLARTAELLMDGPAGRADSTFAPASGDDWSAPLEHTSFGPVHRAQAPLAVAGAAMHWERPATALGSSPAQW